MKSLQLLIPLAVATLAAGLLGADKGPPAPKPTEVFHAGDYRSTRFHVTQADYEAKGLRVRMVQVRDREPHGFLCRGWLRIVPAGGSPRWAYRGELEGVGSSYGLFAPRTQPMPRSFLAVEIKAYEGSLLVVDAKGKIRRVPGGGYLVDWKRRLLFSRSFSDVPPFLAVLDLDSGKTVFQEVEEEIYQWYRLDSDLFFTAAKAEGTGPAEEDRATGYSYDRSTAAITRRPLSPEAWSRAEPVELDFDPRWYQDCTSEERTYGPGR